MILYAASTAPAGARRAQLEVVLGALAFALSVPLARRLLADVQPLALSAGLYLSTGIVLLLVWFVTSITRSREQTMAGTIHGREWLWLAIAILAGAVIGPMALLFGLRRIPGHVAGLLLNFEALFTIGLSALLYGERLGRRGWSGVAAVLVGAVLLSWPHAAAAGAPATSLAGVFLVLAACAAWGVDNNFIQRVSVRDTRLVVGIKGLVGGSVSLALATAFRQLGGWTLERIVLVALVGLVSYGLSIVLFVRGLRTLGVIQTGTLFALAPGFAAILSYLILREPVSPAGLVALGAMTAGALLLATDRHEHHHRHVAIEHTHQHEHDEHHQHDHTPEELAASPHAHRHRHPPIAHTHPHMHDIHHRHPH